MHSLSDCWIKDPIFSLTMGQMLPSLLYHVGIFIIQLTTWQLASSVQASKKRQRPDLRAELKSQSFTVYSQSDIPSLLPLLFIRRKPLDPSHTKSEKIIKEVNSRRWDSFRVISKVVYLMVLLLLNFRGCLSWIVFPQFSRPSQHLRIWPYLETSSLQR